MNARQNERRAAWREWRRIGRQMNDVRAQIRSLPLGPERSQLIAEQRRLGQARLDAFAQYNSSQPTENA
jgi:hypothetical protein